MKSLVLRLAHYLHNLVVTLLRLDHYLVARVADEGPAAHLGLEGEAAEPGEHRPTIDAVEEYAAARPRVSLHLAGDERTPRPSPQVGRLPFGVDHHAGFTSVGIASGRRRVKRNLSSVQITTQAIEQARLGVQPPRAFPSAVAHANEEETLVEPTLLDAHGPRGIDVQNPPNKEVANLAVGMILD